MKTRGLLVAITIIVVFIAGLGIGDWFATVRHQSLVTRLEGEEMLLKNEIERYREVIRGIRSTASQAIPMEKVPQEAAQGK
ncbi:MAG: hypothetical protein PHH75_01900 [Candidatus Omnitrophica bacterium]|nr:hypothetical protein [Candidatus Omnitrophota bacterium]MDD5573913.1 hypothetical protein [Candidatus Omnitrophota bacterium]